MSDVIKNMIAKSKRAIFDVEAIVQFNVGQIQVSRSTIEENITALTARLDEVAYQEIERGVSLIGPHRDDLHLQLGDFPAKGYASHGESWSMAISLRIGSFNLLKSEGASPILILDDVFAELDTSRRIQLMSATQLAEQTFITAAVESDLPAELLTQKFYVTPGVVKKGKS